MSLSVRTILEVLGFSVFLVVIIAGPAVIRLYLIWRFNREAFWKLRF